MMHGKESVGTLDSRLKTLSELIWNSDSTPGANSFGNLYGRPLYHLFPKGLVLTGICIEKNIAGNLSVFINGGYYHGTAASLVNETNAEAVREKEQDKKKSFTFENCPLSMFYAELDRRAAVVSSEQVKKARETELALFITDQFAALEKSELKQDEQKHPKEVKFANRVTGLAIFGVVLLTLGACIAVPIVTLPVFAVFTSIYIGLGLGVSAIVMGISDFVFKKIHGIKKDVAFEEGLIQELTSTLHVSASGADGTEPKASSVVPAPPLLSNASVPDLAAVSVHEEEAAALEVDSSKKGNLAPDGLDLD